MYIWETFVGIIVKKLNEIEVGEADDSPQIHTGFFGLFNSN